LIEKIPAMRWGSRKIDAIDLSNDFYWVDDDHGVEALSILAAHGKADRAIEVSVDRDREALRHAMDKLEQIRGPRFPR
jgi:hypothetical protein